MGYSASSSRGNASRADAQRVRTTRRDRIRKALVKRGDCVDASTVGAPFRPMPLDKDHVHFSANPESKLFVKTNRIFVGFQHVQKGFITARPNRTRYIQCELGREAFTTCIGIECTRH